MANELGISKQAFMGGMDTATAGILWVVLIALLIGLIWFVWWIRQYNKVVIVRKILNDRKVIFKDKVRYLKDRDGNEYYKFLKLRKVVKIPPSDCIEITTKGQYFLECYLLETGEISWIKDTNQRINSIQPFTTEDRLFLMNQYRKAKLEGGVNWKDLIIPIFGILALVIIVVSLMIFYKDMGEPLLAMADKNIQFVTKMTELVEKIDAVSNCTQIVRTGNAPVVLNPSGGVIPN